MRWVSILLPIFVTVCLSLGAALWYQSSTVTSLETIIGQRALLIEDFKTEDSRINTEIVALKRDLAELRTEIRLVESNQNKVLDVIGRLATTLGRLEVAMGKLETKLEYATWQN
jgi:chromosome segregation ATPase